MTVLLNNCSEQYCSGGAAEFLFSMFLWDVADFFDFLLFVLFI